ncbi:GNAT family N-acetyltransferase [Leptotrichia hongkongensis]|uniref:GNAT family N-acetyltransferase n=1 Tax=Leptotrichia hongkongensis TaxID=554406 RepID=UPI0035A83E53
MKIRKATINDLKELSRIEMECFPAAEAATEEIFCRRLEVYPDFFWILENEAGEIVSFVNGMATDNEILTDEMFENPDLHNKNGDWQMIFGVNTLPEFRRKGYAEKVLRRVVEDTKKDGRKGIVLTCKDKLVSFYEKIGFVNEGLSESTHGNAIWYNMRIIF